MNELNPTSATPAPSPSEAERLELHLQSQLNGRIRRLCVQVVDNRIILRGVVSTYHAKQLAQHAVMQLTDVPILNEIEVA